MLSLNRPIPSSCTTRGGRGGGFPNLQLVLRELDPKDICEIQDAHLRLLTLWLGDVQVHYAIHQFVLVSKLPWLFEAR